MIHTKKILTCMILAIISLGNVQRAAAGTDYIDAAKRLLTPTTANAPGPNDITYKPDGTPNQGDIDRLKKAAEERDRLKAEQDKQNQKH